MNRDDVAQATRGPVDWGASEVDTGERQARMAYTLSMGEEDDDLAQWVVAEAGRRGLNPLELMKDLLREAHRRATS